MRVYLLHDHYDEKRLEKVKEEMKIRGRPIIHACWLKEKGAWAALEGCHRLRAAFNIVELPIIIPVPIGFECISNYVDIRQGPNQRIVDVVNNAHKRQYISFSEIWAE